MDKESRLRNCKSITNKPLRFIISTVANTFPDVPLITTSQLGNVLADLEKDGKSPNDIGTEVLLLDIREKPEYEVSHIAGTEFIDFTESYSKQFKSIIGMIRRIRSEKRDFNQKLNVYVYCAVGMRASMFTHGFMKYLKRMQVTSGSSVDPENRRTDDDDTLPYSKLHFQVLEGSIYKWAMEERPLVDNHGLQTSIVHRCSKLWGVIFLDKKLRDSNPVPWIL